MNSNCEFCWYKVQHAECKAKFDLSTFETRKCKCFSLWLLIKGLVTQERKPTVLLPCSCLWDSEPTLSPSAGLWQVEYTWNSSNSYHQNFQFHLYYHRIWDSHEGVILGHCNERKFYNRLVIMNPTYHNQRSVKEKR